ncbi:hypothetical protein [Nonomuraea zeae]|uniref:Uncharacterized protein n=1 Tax=Nonomuraea zeae TaxID=1642303 RepID=A0A5S4FQT7_9ACTN|nr:hypothetical protein [Nonomuraea zeae]TMR22774.1 hypothetical protein ETD85_48895 [Nonomuraea zeae]
MVADMFYVTERISRFWTWVDAMVTRADEALCADQDERARRHGWTVTRTGFGSRHYRDPRFDALKAARLADAGLWAEDTRLHTPSWR